MHGVGLTEEEHFTPDTPVPREELVSPFVVVGQPSHPQGGRAASGRLLAFCSGV